MKEKFLTSVLIGYSLAHGSITSANEAGQFDDQISIIDDRLKTSQLTAGTRTDQYSRNISEIAACLLNGDISPDRSTRSFFHDDGEVSILAKAGTDELYLEVQSINDATISQSLDGNLPADKLPINVYQGDEKIINPLASKLSSIEITEAVIMEISYFCPRTISQTNHTTHRISQIINRITVFI